ncbi:HAMP domain-containing sensor histidine kinase [Arthrobacter methylotrophus]|uniref:histidine kinase n=1 Tax=Arthrobacter methylotrophus TaxID=121291 RepID=A0ABV5ULR7_9MICC
MSISPGGSMERPPGLSARSKLTLSYAAIAVATGVLLLAITYVFLLRYVPQDHLSTSRGNYAPNQGDLIRAFLPAASAALVLIVIMGLGGGWFLAGRVLRPLRQIGEVAQEVSKGSLSARIRMSGRGDEFRHLADVFDEMMERIQHHAEQQRRFAANASHELRTPLAIMGNLAEVGSLNPDADMTELLHRLTEVNARASNTVESLLLLSRVESGRITLGPVDLSFVAEQAVEDLIPAAERAGIIVQAELSRTVVSGDAPLLERVVSNLVHNAVVHGRETVSVRTSDTPTHSLLVVENPGDVIDPTLLPTLIEPFLRKERTAYRAAGEHAGVGLGLSIVAAAVQAHGGTLELSAKPGGGITATVKLPRRTAIP